MNFFVRKLLFFFIFIYNSCSADIIFKQSVYNSIVQPEKIYVIKDLLNNTVDPLEKTILKINFSIEIEYHIRRLKENLKYCEEQIASELNKENRNWEFLYNLQYGKNSTCEAIEDLIEILEVIKKID